MKKPLAIIAGIVAVASLALAAPTAASATETRARETRTISCSTGNFNGQAKVVLDSRPEGVWVTVKEYKITRQNGQSGGNKANVNVAVRSGAYETGWFKSADSMIQDGRWHSGGPTAGLSNYNGVEVGYVQFIFDKSGSDPRCTASTYF
ncbi:hypothetical protein KXS11_12470 [Plantibacter flavus]|uniref:hypothetical protein n=1 Tax=Plantibacter flavus TaxID=150123 RepID=UPI003F144BD5